MVVGLLVIASATGLVDTAAAEIPSSPDDAPRLRFSPRLSGAALHWLKTAVAGAGTLLILCTLVLRRRGRLESHARLLDAVLLGLALVAAASAWPSRIHAWDAYHYYVGGKYLPELGYQRLYACTVVADSEGGLLSTRLDRLIRDLSTGRTRAIADVVLDSESCKKHFSAARWEAFKRDVAWFRGQVSDSRWLGMQQDHGFNGTPVWAVLGRTLANTQPASSQQLLILSLIDPVLLLVMWALVTWAFGWRLACIAVIYWGTSHLADTGWTFGAYLRYDWLAAAVGGICLLRRQRPLAAGFLLGYSALLRIFPVFILAGLILQASLTAWRRHRLSVDIEYRRIGFGAAAALLLFIPASLFVAGKDAWQGFADKAAIHLETPFTNNVGLKVVVAYEHATRAAVTVPLDLDVDAFQPWRDARRRTFEERRYLFVGLVVLFWLLLVRSLRGQELWVAAILSVGMIPVVLQLTNYYYAILLLFALLTAQQPQVGIALCALAAGSRVVATMTTWHDLIYAADSLGVSIFVLFVLTRYAVARARNEEGAEALRPLPRATSS